MATETIPRVLYFGGRFLLGEQDIESLLTAEDVLAECRSLGHFGLLAEPAKGMRAEDFWPGKNITPGQAIRNACAAELANGDIPKEYGGPGLTVAASSMLAERCFGFPACGISLATQAVAAFPIVLLGSAEQKEKYLPPIAKGEWAAAFALSESDSGSDALNVKTRATLSPDGEEWILDGEKVWVTNGGFAHVYIVFAQVDGEKFSAFILERTFPGLTIRNEDYRSEVSGVPVCTLALEKCRVPKQNLLGEVGKGHLAAFCGINIGRLRLAAVSLGSARYSFQHAADFARQRSVFGRKLIDHEACRSRLAKMLAAIHTAESMLYRVAGTIDDMLSAAGKDSSITGESRARAIAECAIEISILKVWSTELLESVTDDGLQLFGVGGLETLHTARIAADCARVNRLCFGANDINRLLMGVGLMKRATRGKLALQAPANRALTEAMSGDVPAEDIQGILSTERILLRNMKKAAAMVCGSAWDRYWLSMADRQEIIIALGNMLTEIFAVESVFLRARKTMERDGEAKAAFSVAASRLVLAGSLPKIESAARTIAAAAVEDAKLARYVGRLDSLFSCLPFNTLVLCDQIAQSIL